MKKLTAAIAGFAALAGSAAALAAQPQWGSPYSSAKTHQPPSGPGTVNIYVGSKASHRLMEVYNGATAKRLCSSKYSWSVGHVKIGRSGRWSATHANKLPGAKKAMIHVTGVFTSYQGGHGAWQVQGCTKHSFKFHLSA